MWSEFAQASVRHAARVHDVTVCCDRPAGQCGRDCRRGSAHRQLRAVDRSQPPVRQPIPMLLHERQAAEEMAIELRRKGYAVDVDEVGDDPLTDEAMVATDQLWVSR
jgi:hypothetical protein